MKKLVYLSIVLLFSSCIATVDLPNDDIYIYRPTPPVRWYNGYYYQYYNPGVPHHYTPHYYHPRPRPYHNGPRPPRPRR